MRKFIFIVLLLSGMKVVYGADTRQSVAQLPQFNVCHGYDCTYQTRVRLTAGDVQKINDLFAKTGQNAAGERAAIRESVAVFEQRNTQVIGVQDEPRMEFGRSRRVGQMDCIDESKNTEQFLKYLAATGLMRFHQVDRRNSRGFFLDGRYPHWTAVIRENNGQRWAVDSWYEPGGGLPDIMPYQEWKKRGRNGGR